MPSRFLVPVTLALILCGAAAAAVARQEAPAPAAPGSTSSEPAPAAPGSAVDGAPGQETAPDLPPDQQSPYIIRVYKIRPAKLFKGLLEALEAEGYPPEETDEAKRAVKTSFVDFKQDDYELQVGEPPQRLGQNYQLLQMIKIKVGKVSLQGAVAPVKAGTELRLRARILVMGLDRVKRTRVLVDRRSTGVIESEFIHKLESRLGLEHL